MKRATSLSIEPDGQHVAVADKTGDVYRYAIEAAAEEAPVPALGHVSLLTTVLVLPDGQSILTADRDDHIRWSNWPGGFLVRSFLLGHKRCVVPRVCPLTLASFVSALAVADDCLLSAGGDPVMLVWSLSAQKLWRKVDLSPLLDHLIVGSELAVLKILIHRGLAIVQASGALSLLVFTLADLLGDGAATGRTVDLGAPVLDLCTHGDDVIAVLDAERGTSAPIRRLDVRDETLVDADAGALAPLLAVTRDGVSIYALAC